MIRIISKENQYLSGKEEIAILKGLEQLSIETDLQEMPIGEEMIALEIRKTASNLSEEIFRIYQKKNNSRTNQNMANTF